MTREENSQMDTNGYTPLCEDYVSFEVAKTLQEKGFDELCSCLYNKKTMERTNPREYVFNGVWSAYVLCPTIQMATKWLREKHYIYADPIKQGNYNDCSEYYTWIVARMGIIHRNPSVVDKLSYKQAVEAALKYALENLI